MAADYSWTVHIYENGRHVGRLAPNGDAVTRVIHAAMFTQERAEEIAGEINAGIGLVDEVADRQITAKATRF